MPRKIEIKKCLICESEFETRTTRQTCSRKCQNKLHENVCVICDKKFNTHNKRINTCSELCKKENERRNHYISGKKYNAKFHVSKITICKVCGNEFIRTDGKQKICSEECKIIILKNSYSIERKRVYNKLEKYVKKCVVCNNDFETYKPNVKCCSSECSKSLHKTNKRKSVFNRFKLNGYPSNDIIKKRLSLFDNCCYCDSYADKTIEHLVPISKGGTNAMYNLFGSCLKCNLSKGSKNFLTWYRNQSFYNPIREYEILQNSLAG